MHYSIEHPKDEGVASILNATLGVLKADPQMQADLSRLERACCEPQRFVTLLGAPVPTESTLQ